MQFSCPHPGCGAVYKVATKTIGQRFTCKKCNSALVMDEDGLELADSSLGPLPGEGFGDEPLVSPRTGGYHAGNAFEGSLGSILGDLATWSFGVGCFFVILFLFLPIIDQTKVMRASALVDAGDNLERRLDHELQMKIQKDGGIPKGDDSGKDKFEDEKKKRKETKEKWEKEKLELQIDVDSARTGARRSIYWYTYGMMFGFLCLAFASLGYLKPQQTTIRRVVGSIIICALVLLIFFSYIVFSTTVTLAARI